MNQLTLTIIGFGRFGQTLYRLLKDHFNITLYTRNPKRYSGIALHPHTQTTQSLDQAYASDVIFYCTPISTFEHVITQHTQHIKPNHLLIDTLSVKLHPKYVFEKILYLDSHSGGKTPTKSNNNRTIEQYSNSLSTPQVLLSHPMFGPDSAKDSFQDLPIVLDQYQTNDDTYTFWKTFFTNQGLKVVEMTADEHDRLAARSQGVAHYLGRVLEKIDFKPTPIDTLGAKKLNEIMEQTIHDTPELFRDLQTYNPYTKDMRLELREAIYETSNQLIPDHITPDTITYGIQGGPGSFNEEALNFYTSSQGIKDFQAKYLYTTEKVLNALTRGDIDYGLFAIQNSVGGVVNESTNAMAHHRFQIIEEFAIPIQHHLQKLPGTKTEDLHTIMAHPQVLKQCKTHLANHYPQMNLKSGEGDLIDTAQAGKALSEGQLDPNTAILGAKTISKLYGLEIIDRNLQDDPTNNTSFFLVSR